MNFDTAVTHVLRQEGGFQKRHDDPGNWTGGAVGKGQLKGTNYGISAKSYPDLNLVTLTRDEAIAIYKRDFWKVAGCDFAPPLLRLALLDAAVNCGTRTAVRWLQGLTDVTPDGLVGPYTRAAWANIKEPRDVLEDFMWARVGYHNTLVRRNTNMRGWLPIWIARCLEIRLASLE